MTTQHTLRATRRECTPREDIKILDSTQQSDSHQHQHSKAEQSTSTSAASTCKPHPPFSSKTPLLQVRFKQLQLPHRISTSTHSTERLPQVRRQHHIGTPPTHSTTNTFQISISKCSSPKLPPLPSSSSPPKSLLLPSPNSTARVPLPTPF